MEMRVLVAVFIVGRPQASARTKGLKMAFAGAVVPLVDGPRLTADPSSAGD